MITSEYSVMYCIKLLYKGTINGGKPAAAKCRLSNKHRITVRTHDSVPPPVVTGQSYA